MADLAKQPDPIALEVASIALQAKAASRALATVSSAVKDDWLHRSAEALMDACADILTANEQDVGAANEKGLAEALVDRLVIDEKRLRGCAEGLTAIAALPDPVGEVTRMWTRPNGLRVGRMRIPLGVIGFIYESRPLVTVDAAALCVKSGNAVILRGGSEAFHSNQALITVLTETARMARVPEHAIQTFSSTDRACVDHMLEREDEIDLIIPRGGEGLIRAVADKSRIPVLKHYKGVCHVFIDADADPYKAVSITVNAKVQRPSVCNAMETLLVHAGVAKTLLPGIAKALQDKGVEIRGCEKTCALVPNATPATEADWSAEYLDLILAVRVVDTVEAAIAHIQTYGSDHTESIITESYTTAQKFLTELTSSSVMVNTSTRFADGFEYGLGAEIGISTTKLHAYGPMGLEGLTSTKFIVYGDGQIRQ